MITARPSTTFEATASYPTGLTGTVAVRIIDNAGNTTTARTTTGITEYPAGLGVYQATLTAPAAAGQYTLIWDDGTNEPDGVSIEDLVVSPAGYTGDSTGPTYSTTTELARILKITRPSSEQNDALTRVLVAATGEVNSEIDRDADADDLTGWQLALAEEVTLERAVELWKDEESPFGIIGMGDGPVYTARNSWERHAHKLAPLKAQWGLA